jgi:drug/metabolite transporter (DMT)-like permease
VDTVTETAVVITALASALAAATSSVLQHRSARLAPHGETHRLLGHLLTRPAWIAGLLTAGVGLVLHAVALAPGQLAVVQPLLISGVLFALPVSALLERRRPSAVEWLWAFVLVFGLAVFLLSAHPSRGRVGLDADVLAWSTLGGGAAVAVVTLFGMRWPFGHASVLLGMAAGLGYGVDAALLKQTTTVAGAGLVHLLTDWPLYAFIGMGGASLVLTQVAYRSGSLAGSMPALTVTDPAASVLIGALAFQEHLATGAWSIAGQVIGGVLVAGAATLLARREKAGPAAEPVTVAPPV